MKKITYMALLLTAVLLVTGCQRNYYSGGGKSGGCGCPGTKGMVGF
jgi:hypothetical protein